MNLVEKMTEPSFTSSSKGLMTLFCIGVIHQTVGIEFIDTAITIPWLPKIEFLHAERLFDLYLAFVAYATYRYTLHSLPTLRAINARSLSKGLKETTRGKRFIRKYVTTSDDYLVSEPVVGEGSNNTSISINIYGEEDSPSTDIFTIEFVDSVNVNSAKYQSHIALGSYDYVDHKSWGGFRNTDTDGTWEYFASRTKPSLGLRARLGWLNLTFTLSLMPRSPFGFDFLMPLVLNVSLLVYCLSTM